MESRDERLREIFEAFEITTPPGDALTVRTGFPSLTGGRECGQDRLHTTRGDRTRDDTRDENQVPRDGLTPAPRLDAHHYFWREDHVHPSE